MSAEWERFDEPMNAVENPLFRCSNQAFAWRRVDFSS